MSCALDRPSTVSFLEILAADTNIDTGVPSRADAVDDPHTGERVILGELLIWRGAGAKNRGAGGLSRFS